MPKAVPPSCHVPVRAIVLRRLCVGLLFAAFVSRAHAQGTVGIRDIEWETYPASFRCVVSTERPIQINNQDLIDERGLFYVDLYNVHCRIERPIEEFDNLFLRAVKFKGYPSERVLRMIFWPQPGIRYKVRSAPGPSRIIVELVPDPASSRARNDPANPPSSSVTKPVFDAPAPTPSPARSSAEKENTPTGFQNVPPVAMPTLPFSPPSSVVPPGRKKVIIDPGHGGYNTGANGIVRLKSGRVQEKDINLQVSLLLAGLIQKAGNMDYRLTRRGDTHISLYNRVRMAENIAEPGDGQSLFVSLHCNWWNTSDPRGVEIYYLDETTKEANAALRELENDEAYKEDLKENASLSKIFLGMEQDKLKQRKAESAYLGAYLNQSFRRSPYFKSYNRGVKTQNFSVLKNFLVPAVLVEIGFISNPEECRMLMDADHQYNVAASLFNGINYYFKAQDPSFDAKEYKLR